MNMKKHGLAGGAILVVMALVLIAGPLVAIAQGSPAGTSIVDLDTVSPPQREIPEAQRRGQAWVDKIAVIDSELSEWQGARLTSPQPFHNPKGEVIAFMFAIEKNGKTVGRVLVGGSAYGYSILEASEGPPLSIPARGVVSSILRKEQGLQMAEATLGEPMLLLLNILRGFYAVWEVEGQVVGINLIRHDSFVAPRLEDIMSSMPSPEEYEAAKKATSQSLPEMRLQSANWGSGEIPHAVQMRGDWAKTSNWDHPGTRPWYCGPSAATTIALWKRDFDGDTGFPSRELDQQGRWLDVLDIYDGFDHWNMGKVTMWWQWRNGFIGYAESPGVEEHFTLARRTTYWHIVSDIDNGWPLGLMGEMTGPDQPKEKPHWVSVKEYFWIGGSDYLIIVADTWWAFWCPPTANHRFLCWNALNAPGLLGPWVRAVRDTD